MARSSAIQTTSNLKWETIWVIYIYYIIYMCTYFFFNIKCLHKFQVSLIKYTTFIQGFFCEKDATMLAINSSFENICV